LVNTNLVEISDWLTKIIVGVGLIELRRIPPQARRLALEVAGPSGDISFALAVVVYFPTLGFLFGYLSTRLFLAGAFSRAESEHLERKKKILELGPTLRKQVELFATSPTISAETAGVDEGPETTEGHDLKGDVDEGPAEDFNERDSILKKLADLTRDEE